LDTICWAYQLHYYLCFRTRRAAAVFTAPERVEALPGGVARDLRATRIPSVAIEGLPGSFALPAQPAPRASCLQSHPDDQGQEMRVIGHDGNAINGEAARGRNSPPILDQCFSQSGIEDAAAITRGEDQMMV